MPDMNDPTTVGAAITGLGVLGAALLQVRRMLRRDKEDASASGVVVSLNGAAKAVIEEMRGQLAEMKREMVQMGERYRAEIDVLSKRIATIFAMHEQCQLENRQLRIELDDMKRKTP